MPKKPFQSTQQASGTYIAQATYGASSTINVFNVDKDAPPEVLAAVLEAVQASAGANTLPVSKIEKEADLIVTGAPTAPNRRISRARLSSLVSGALSKPKPVLLRGDSGSGRSELARATTEKATRLIWIDFQANGDLRPGSVLESVLSDQINLRSNRRPDFGKVVGKLDKDLAVVLDNIDQSAADPSFVTRLAVLARAAASGNIKLICCSLYPLPLQLRSEFEVVPVPSYDDDEVRELLVTYGAPAAVNHSQFRGVVLGLTQGHPDLTALLVEFLTDNEWVLSDDVWQGLIGQAFASDLKNEVQRRLLSTETAKTRELLFRLNAVMRDFTESEALEIARIEPEIPEALARLSKLSGRWLQQQGTTQWRTSPLIAALGDNNLAAAVRNKVHKRVAGWILSRKKLNQLETNSVISHLVIAEEYDQAGSILLRALYSLLNAGPDVEPGNLLSLWKGLPLPTQMNLGLKICIRGMQVAIAIQRGQGYGTQLADLRDLMKAKETISEPVMVFASLSAIALQLVSKSPIEALPFITESIEMQSRISDPRILKAFRGHSSSEFFWSVAMQIRSRDGVRQWVAAVDALSEEERRAMMAERFAPESACRMFDSLWIEEQELPEQKRDWAGLTRLIGELETVVSRWDSSLVSGGLLRAAQAIRIVHIGDAEEAIRQAEAFFSAHIGPNAAAGRFLVAQGTGLWLTDVDRWADALPWLGRGVEYHEKHLTPHRQSNLLRYGHALYRAGRPDAAPFYEAVQLAEDGDFRSPLGRIRARAELATFLWLTEGEQALFDEWTHVVRATLEAREESPRWKQIYVLIANHTAYWGNRFGQDSEFGGTSLVKPDLGMFITDYADISDRYSDKILFVLPGNMTWFAEKLGRFREAAEWAQTTYDCAVQFGQSNQGNGFRLQAAPYALEQSRYREAIDAVADGVRSLAKSDPIEFPEAVVRDNPRLLRLRLPSLDPVRTESNTVILGLLPSLIGVTAEILNDRARGMERIEELVRACTAQREIASVPAPWEEAQRVLYSVRNGTLHYADFASEENASEDHIGQAANLLRSFGLLAVRDERTVDILTAQVKWARWLTMSLAPFWGVGSVFASIVANAWSNYVLANGFNFQRPASLVKVIQEHGGRGELGCVLIDVADGLGASVPQSLREKLMSATFTLVPGRSKL
ncbi:hypothetical protein HNQ77_001007 [Silvibacterium bohemicum]|uniref:Uncharacterized protein n=1 Tax=Silvibacterium bohemicum TaxID=1577686 RepID=A0A841JP48_9BACT|nr:hypothetical protein [Silvibacterium bohemicum]MBB6143063.1 hypothetical protein [Silvibacterium bohemicum]